MRKILFNPFTCLVAVVGLFFALRAAFGGHPHSWYGALGFLALFAYGCGLVFLLQFFGSGWYPAVKRLAFPDAWEHPIFRASMGCTSMLFQIVYFSATLLIFIVPAGKLLSFMAAWATIVTVAATVPLLRDPSAPAPVS